MSLEPQRAPLYEMLETHAGLGTAPFHVPGHKQRSTWQHPQADHRYEALLPLDVTELPDTDDLHHSYGAIIEAERLAAQCFGAEETRFLIGGSTAGNLAMILGVSSPGDLLIVQRNVHRSIVHGLMIAGIKAVFLQPKIEPHTGLALIPDIAAVEEAVARYPEARGLLLSTPNYYGRSAEIRTIVRLCHGAGIPVLVDEAHGPHFGLHPSFPCSALQSGADVVVQSAHKMLTAMTMGAMLHFQGSLVDREPIRAALRMVQSSSPSFPILASLDLARRQVHMQGSAAFEPALEAVKYVRDNLPDTAFRALGNIGATPIEVTQDPLKLVLYDPSGQWSGFRIREELASRGCVAEMADTRYAVLAFGAGSRPEDGRALIRALMEMTETYAETGHSETKAPFPDLHLSETAYAISEPVVFRRSLPPTARVRLDESVGRTAGEWVVPYPPGIPELFPGEPITEAALSRIRSWRDQAASIQGPEDPALGFIRVLQK
ncbi:aminotransferase class I/II-fold pyridoxal phosphate-dependent enzyme [Cohnella pontilimi]|uniref:Aminotransferase class I/II-fold pyridoxal phosphate-dependent enzyme n=1 Tax=Cohnella pontilimi TaxID=2564100 RepID=A0A4U0F361_9BACL|nr:aminotransferase class I/II-fold pyridoxal phosphate-dependent enzyme [Cohnella pontilimi]TJY38598.1 aminotransferase class I/II-fold pyridoxal phosphate-dependent enzyme [Cohnella pontilimi]